MHLSLYWEPLPDAAVSGFFYFHMASLRAG